MFSHNSALLVLSFFSLSHQSPIAKRSFTGPVFPDNFPDPSFIQDPTDNSWYAFSTTSAGQNVPTAHSPDFNTWTIIDGYDALPTVGAWSTGANVWAPDVVQLSNGNFVLYYTATSTQDPSAHCIGAATSTNAKGPYTPIDASIACPTDQGGAIDPAGFADVPDASGTPHQYVVYKIDGNSIGPGGNCNNGNGPESGLKDTPIMLQEVSPTDGYSTIGEPVTILHRGAADGPLVEAPSLVRVDNGGSGLYVLFFSSNCYAGPYYDTSYATSTNGVTNGGQPYQKSAQPLLVTGTGGLYSPGGLDVGVDGSKVLFHADEGQTADTRQLYSGVVTIGQDGVVTI